MALQKKKGKYMRKIKGYKKGKSKVDKTLYIDLKISRQNIIQKTKQYSNLLQKKQEIYIIKKQETSKETICER